ncbi:MAG TPA: ABC transporter permease, partial [Bryobacteraceae bacterium]|nr:ABC transporter permease [Bryobacteraceae bacterium]
MEIPGKHFLRNLISGRTLLVQLIKRDFKQRFIGSAGGWLWALIHPLVQLAVLTFVFQVCLKVPVPAGEVTTNYTVFLACGYLPWLLFQETVLRSSSALLENSNLITKTVFPSEVVAIAVFVSSLLTHLIALALVMILVGFWDGGISPMVLLLPFYMALLGLFAVGLGWVFSSLQIYLRDTVQVLTVIMTLWFWMTPIFIAEENVPAQFRWVMQLNPLAHVVRAYRDRI